MKIRRTAIGKSVFNSDLKELILIQKLGAGQFGNVYLVYDKNKSEFYALKVLSKAQIIKDKLYKYILEEKTVMEKIDFPFIMRLLRTYKDNKHLYLLTEFVKGIELFDAIRDIGVLDSTISKFYIGTLILCLEYMNSLNIVYRDLKPENVMVDDIVF